ncbi:MAG: carbohydrate ABC transporter permease [Armatimonadetes bacterium]|nr:carbohydrate ABC transporter permease [Armatimonadota bacterium]
MSLVGKVGRKRPRARFAMLMLYGLLLIGAVTTLYPFLLMVSTGFKGPTDQDDGRMVPTFWSDPAELEEKYLHDKYAGDLGMITSYSIGAEAEAATLERYEQFLLDLPHDRWTAGFRTPANHITSRLRQRYQGWLRKRYGRDIAALNDAYGELNQAFQTVTPRVEAYYRPGWSPKDDEKWRDWVEFKQGLPAEFRIPLRQERFNQEWIRTRFAGQISDVPKSVRHGVATFDEIRVADIAATELAQMFEEEGAAPVETERASDGAWGELGLGEMPVLAFDRLQLTRNAPAIKREMSSRNYRFVIDYIALNGRALWNTAIFCGLAVLLQLTINPLAAYALSRFPMKATARLLLFLLATMAFPAEVAMIPAFLLLKNLGLLNTFAALVLPTAANGYMIFLLKGFFDSLPREIFESGQIDGASETTMMLKLAMPLSKPVLGYMALLAFMGAYGAFLYAFLVAQDKDIWTLMVFIYQLQQIAPKSVMMAAVALAALPTIAVFLAAQRVIMRGIVLPGER